MDLTLHHCAAVVIFNVAFPSGLRHRRTLGEALFPEVLDGVIIGVSQEVV